MSAVAAMAMQTMKLLVTHTNLGPTFRHIGSIRKELNPRTICTRWGDEAPGQQLTGTEFTDSGNEWDESYRVE